MRQKKPPQTSLLLSFLPLRFQRFHRPPDPFSPADALPLAEAVENRQRLFIKTNRNLHPLGRVGWSACLQWITSFAYHNYNQSVCESQGLFRASNSFWQNAVSSSRSPGGIR